MEEFWEPFRSVAQAWQSYLESEICWKKTPPAVSGNRFRGNRTWRVRSIGSNGPIVDGTPILVAIVHGERDRLEADGPIVNSPDLKWQSYMESAIDWKKATSRRSGSWLSGNRTWRVRSVGKY